MGGMAFLSAEAVLPAMVRELGGPDWVVAFMPMALLLGFFTVPLFIVHIVERIHSQKRVVLVGSLLQRTPYLLAGVFLIWSAGAWPEWELWVAAATPAVSGLAGGFCIPSFLDWVSRTVPKNQTASMMAIRQGMGAVLGLLAGVVIERVLSAYPGSAGYGVLHVLVFISMMVSWGALWLFCEDVPPREEEPQRLSLVQSLASLPGLVRGNRSVGYAMGAMFFSTGLYVVLPFLSIHALHVTEGPESWLGWFVGAQTVGLLMGNVWAGWYGDRTGARDVMIVGSVLMMVTFVLGSWGETFGMFVGVYGLFGLSFGTYMVGSNSIVLELAPVKRRATFLSLMTSARAPGMVLAGLFADDLWAMGGDSLWLASGVCVAAQLACMVCLLKLPRLRHEPEPIEQTTVADPV